MPSGFTILDHPADAGIEVYADALPSLFVEAAKGFMALIGEELTVEPKETRRVTVEAVDLPALLVRWLSEILFLIDGEKFLTADVRIVRATETAVEAEVTGERANPARHSLAREVKAVTYHQISVERHGAEGWIARVFVDL